MTSFIRFVVRGELCRAVSGRHLLLGEDSVRSKAAFSLLLTSSSARFARALASCNSRGAFGRLKKKWVHLSRNCSMASELNSELERLEVWGPHSAFPMQLNL
uniref:MIP32083p1 n=1 Tax=Drosophila melanogaster TaxID=7227 RepID=G2J5Y8_DROME|nr:MIP32083p1 [Drosophila melanogaster]